MHVNMYHNISSMQHVCRAFPSYLQSLRSVPEAIFKRGEVFWPGLVVQAVSLALGRLWQKFKASVCKTVRPSFKRKSNKGLRL